MQLYKQIIKYIVVCVASVLITLVLHNYIIKQKPNTVSTNVVYYPYYTTVYHENPPQIWKLISADAATDTAYYIVDKDALCFTMPEINDEVTFYTDFSGVINDITTAGFSVKITRGQIIYGMSGMPVYNADNEVIGYISAAANNDVLFCIWR